MKNGHAHHPSPFFVVAVGILLFWLFGFKLFFFLPLFFIFGGMSRGCWGMGHHHDEWSDEKPKRKGKPKRDDYYVEDEDDIRYV